MPKTLESPVVKFPGSVTIPDFLTLKQVFDYEDATERAAGLKGTKGIIRRSALDDIYLPVLFDIVLEWRITGQPEKPTRETWHATPRRESADLTTWIINEVTKIYIGEIEIPNA